MPRRFSNPFGSNSSTATAPTATATGNEKSSILPRMSVPRGKSFTHYFSAGYKAARQESQTASQALMAASHGQISPASLSLPTISLSTAAADSQNADEPPTTLFQPPSPAEAKRIARQHAQFGPLGSQAHRYVSRHHGGELPDPIIDEPPYFFLLMTYVSYLLLIVFGHVRDFFGKRFRKGAYAHLMECNGYAPLNSDFDSFYTRRLKLRLGDCFSRPTSGVPGRYITLLDRKSDNYNVSFQYTGTYTETLNMSSYNYLGFAQSDGPCADATEDVVRRYGVAMASSRGTAGTNDLHVEVDDLVAKFVGKEAAMVFSMGYATNATIFPALVGKGCLIISDELNHASIRVGSRLSGATIGMFKHNNMVALERVLRDAISQGQPRTHRPWKKILVAVEGLYSMEGTMCNLPGIVKLKKKYKFYLFVDEAHSIGALGPRGRGVCDYFGINPADVDILMGTLTKSFGANGGYVAADRAMIEKLRCTNSGTIFGESPPPLALGQIATALKLISGEVVPGQGEERLQRLAFNSRYLRLSLKRLGFIVYGHDDSPIIPILLYNPAKIMAFSREMLMRKISVVVVGYPATPLIESRVRFCVSAAHTKDDIDRLLMACDEIGGLLQLKFSSGIAGGREPLPEGVTPEMEKDYLKRRGKEFGSEYGFQPPRWKIAAVIRRGVKDVQNPLR